MAPSDFKNADVADIAAKLTTDEAILLTAGVGFWHTHEIQRLGIPAIKVSDGPNGERSPLPFNEREWITIADKAYEETISSWEHQPNVYLSVSFSSNTPSSPLTTDKSSTALGSTWDTKLVEEVGLKLLSAEAKLRSASVILAPTCNIQRNPLGGRSFESFSEDPVLSGLISAAYVNGVQKGGIGTTIKHFVCNDKENDRLGYDSVVSDRTLREVYLMPFMLAQKYAQPWAMMTAYNRVNGTHVSENPFLLQKILRDEWRYDGMVMSDWFGIYSIDLSVNAGLDLEMPGTNKWRTLDLMNRSIQARKLTTRTVKSRAKRVLELVKKCANGAPEVLDGDGLELTVEKEEDKDLMRRVAAESIVLLKNDAKVLPLNPKDLRKVAIVGGNAKALVLSGGGSAALKASYFISPYEGICNALKSAGDVEVTYSEGARAYMTMPTLDYDLFTESGERGWTGFWHSHEDDESMTKLSEPIHTQYIDETRMFISTSTPKGITRKWTLVLKGYLRPRPYDIDFDFGLTVAGRAKLFVDGQLVIDNWTRQRRGEAFFGCGSEEEHGIFPLKANQKHKIVVEFCNVRAPADGDEDEAVMDSNPGVRLGGAEVQDADKMMESAVELAKEADAVIAVVGLNADWETEGYDRTTLALPGRTDELIEKVAAANKNTIVVTQSGSAITMPWINLVSTLVHAWYLGNASGDAIADVIFGKKNPSGKLSMTFPVRLEDVPAHGHFHSEAGKVRYGEELYVGYKHYQHRNIAPLFAFGYGLSYTTFSYSELKVSEMEYTSGGPSVTVSLTVSNTGTVSGSEVVQLYVSHPESSLVTHPGRQLKAFAKVVDLHPGKSEQVIIPLDKYAFSYWDIIVSAWVVDKGSYGIYVGQSSDGLLLEGTVEATKVHEWNGI